MAFYDEMYGLPLAPSSITAKPLPHYTQYHHLSKQYTQEIIALKRLQSEATFRQIGITFSVNGDDIGIERLIPFDLIPRIMPPHEWSYLKKGLIQRVQALNSFVHDIYHEQKIIKSGLIPPEQIYLNAQYRPQMQGLQLVDNNYCHISGIDIVRAGQGEFYVLEDNLRVPSGVSYMLEGRKMMMRLFPQFFSTLPILPIEHYPNLLLDTLRNSAPASVEHPTIVILTPGQYNSAYFEHAFLAQHMGIDLVQGKDLFVDNGFVYMHTTQMPKKVDVIYRRIDDDFLDPLVFRSDSTLGVPGLMSVYRMGNVTITNAVGTGIADDKSTYPYIPDMIKFYLNESPILNNVPTYQCRKPSDLSYVLANLHHLVVKEVHGAGGYGMLVGPVASTAQLNEFRARLINKPENYIAQPTLALSTCPTYVDQGIAPRHVDFRPYVLFGKQIHLVPGGLCRVALTEHSLVVNSSQGGGTKDTWILDGDIDTSASTLADMIVRS
jgi:uncharacterized circularly permuted ATP-grasp superfamily protein